METTRTTRISSNGKLKLTAFQLGYIVGFLEGEGSFILFKNKGRYTSRIATSQKDPKPLLYVQKLIGGYIRYEPRKGSEKSPTYQHDIFDQQTIKKIIQVIYPYLISPRTRKRAWCVYRMATLKNKTGGKIILSKENLAERKRVYKIWETTRRPKKGTSRGK